MAKSPPAETTAATAGPGSGRVRAARAVDARRPPQRPRDRKQTIARHARELFSERGYNSVTMNDIADAVGITAGALYRHYGNKQDLLFDIVRSSLGRFVSALDDPHASNAENCDRAIADPLQQLDDALVAVADASLNSEHFAALWQREARHLTLDDQQAIRVRLNTMTDQITRIIASAHTGFSVIGADIAGWAVLAVMVSPGHHNLNLPRPAFDRFLVAACRAILTAVGEQSQLNPDGEPTMTSAAAKFVTEVSRREQILAAAARAFRTRGFQGVGTDEIGADAGVAGPGLYRYFDSKSDILVTLIRRQQEWVAYESTQSLRHAAATDSRAALTALVFSYVKVGVRAPDLLSVSITEWLDLPADAAEDLDRVRHDNWAAWVHWLQQARPGLSRADGALLVQTAISLIQDTVRVTHLLRTPGVEHLVATMAVALMFDTTWT